MAITTSVDYVLREIAKMGSSYINIRNGRGNKTVPTPSWTVYDDYINNLIKRYPDKSSTGRSIILEVTLQDNVERLYLTREIDPNYSYGRHTSYLVTLPELKKSDITKKGRVIYQYRLPESVIRKIINLPPSELVEIDEMYKSYVQEIVQPIVSEYNKKVEQAREEANSRKEREANYTKYNPWDSSEVREEKQRKLFGPHWKELDMYGVGKGTDWEIYKKQYSKDISNVEEAEYYLNQVQKSYNIYPAEDKIFDNWEFV